jgi:DNA-binding winged helix-turn-helix (wHTH) protein/WD40 repeat protein
MGVGTGPERILAKNVSGSIPPGPSEPACNLYRFGVFELREETGELWKHGVRIRLQSKPLKILLALLEKPGGIVTREELCARLWPPGTFVDFESGLNTATNRLRVALGDAAESPRYVETLARVGYRFVCPVTKLTEPAAAVVMRRAAYSPPIQVEESQSSQLAESQCEQVPASVGKSRAWDKILRLATSILAIFGITFALLYFGPGRGVRFEQPTFRQLTFKPGTIGSARFTSDANHVIYTAATDAGWQTYELGLNRLSDASATPFKVADTYNDTFKSSLFAIRRTEAVTTLEFPVGRVAFESEGWIDCARISPKGDKLALLSHPLREDDAGGVVVVDRSGVARVLTAGWNSIEGLAWSPAGEEIWFTASKEGTARALYTVSRRGHLRPLANMPASLRLLDVSRAGQALLALDDAWTTLTSKLHGKSTELDSSNVDSSHVDGISLDGNQILFTEGGGPHYSAYLFDQRSRRTTRVAGGRGLALSSDGASVVTIDPIDRTALVITSLLDGKSRAISGMGFQYQWAKFMPKRDELLVGGNYPGGTLFIARQSANGGKPVAISVPYLDDVALSSDGHRLAGTMGTRRLVVFNIPAGIIETIAKPDQAVPVAWSRDSEELYAVSREGAERQIWRINMATHESTVWRTIAPGDRSAFDGFARVVAAPETGAYAYSTLTNFSRLYVVEGLS